MNFVPSREAPTLAKARPRPGLYRHFKGGEYELLSVAHHSETEELLAVYGLSRIGRRSGCGRLRCSRSWLSTRTPSCRGSILSRAAPRNAVGWIG
jgi:hypothetical protein